MARIRRSSDGEMRTLAQDCLVGRSAEALITLASPRASSRHASFSWGHRGWELRDLGSRNGTVAGGRRLSAGSPVQLKLGTELMFGEAAETWVLECDAPPLPAARRLGSTELRQLEDGYLLLPSTEQPLASVYEHPSLGWLLESEDGAIDSVQHEQVLTVGGVAWKLHLIDATSTLAISESGVRLEGSCMRFIVSPDEEHVTVELSWPEEIFELPPSVHWYTVLLLARARMSDQGAGLSPREQGWVYRDELCKQLRTSPQKLNVDIHRLRKLLAKAGVSDSASLIERRSATSQLRLGVAELRLD